MSHYSLSAATADSLIAESLLERYLARNPVLQGSAPVVIARFESMDKKRQPHIHCPDRQPS